MAKSRKDNPQANGGENAPSAGHSGTPRLHEKERERNGSGQAFRYSYFFGMQSDTPAETLSRCRYLKKESPESKSREERWPDRKIPIRKTRYTKRFRRMSFLTFPAEYDSGPTEKESFREKEQSYIFMYRGGIRWHFSDQTVGIRGKDSTFSRSPSESSRHSMKSHEAQPRAGIRKI